MHDADDRLITDAFDDFTAGALPHVRPAGSDSVRGTVRQRRRVRSAALSVLAAVMIVVPVAAYTTIDKGSQGPPADPAGSGSPASTGPDGRLTIAELTAGPVPVPDWNFVGVPADQTGRCTSGDLRLGAGDTAIVAGYAWVQEVVHANLDADTALETAALLKCYLGRSAWSQVAVFDRDPTGAVVSHGQLVSSAVGVGGMFAITVDAQGRIAVDVSNLLPTAGLPPEAVVHQTRVYGFDGTGLRQLDGPTEFLPGDRAVDLGAVVNSTTFGAPYQRTDPDGQRRTYRTATVELTVTNHSAVASGQWAVLVQGFRWEPSDVVAKPQQPLDGLTSRSITVSFQLPAIRPADVPPLTLDILELGTTATNPDPDPSNNHPLVGAPRD
jgi:hypothetical protein